MVGYFISIWTDLCFTWREKGFTRRHEALFEISVGGTEELFNFQVINNGADKCGYEVFAGNKLVAVFEPDGKVYFQMWRSPGGLGKEVIVQIADRIEAHYL